MMDIRSWTISSTANTLAVRSVLDIPLYGSCTYRLEGEIGWRRAEEAPAAVSYDPAAAAGPGAQAPVDALHPHGRLRRRPRGPDHRPRRGPLRLRRARQALPRRPLRAVLRQRRPRPHRARRGDGRAGRASSTSSPIWSYAHPRAIELAAKIASLAPGDLNRVFFTSGGSEAVESAIKLARAYHQRTGNPRKTKFISRDVAYHGTTLGALSATGITALRTEFEPLVPGGFQMPNTNSYHWPEDRDPLWAADQIEEAITSRARRRSPR